VKGYGAKGVTPTCAKCGKEVVVGPVVKMSKSLKNIVDPDELVNRYGADTMRVFVLFTSPPENNLEWSDAGVEGAARFLQRLYRLVFQHHETVAGAPLPEGPHPLRRLVHKTLKRVTQDAIERFHFNTAIAAIMELLNGLSSFQPKTDEDRAALKEALELTVLMVSPFAPHLAEELWSALGKQGLVATQSWPAYDPELARDEKITIVVQVNGKLRGQIEVAPDAAEETIKEAALYEPNVMKHVAGRTPKKVVYVKGRLVNVVV